MILEQVILPVRPGQEADFEAAFGRAISIIQAAQGCQSVNLSRCIERPNAYLLLVQWTQLEDHTIGFRESDAYQEWRQLLHHFYDPVPEVEHFKPLVSV